MDFHYCKTQLCFTWVFEIMFDLKRYKGFLAVGSKCFGLETENKSLRQFWVLVEYYAETQNNSCIQLVGTVCFVEFLYSGKTNWTLNV